MSKNKVQFLDQKIESFTIRTDSFEFKPSGRFAWAQKLAWKFLHWSSCLSRFHEEREKISVVTIDTDDFMEAIFRQRESIAQHFNRDGQTLYIGSEDFSALMGSQQVRNVMEFRTAFHIGRNGQREIMGLEVRVIPWMRGFIVV